jgi:hypothetical protein
MEEQRVIHSRADAVRAKDAPSAANSVFDIAKKKHRGRASPFNPDAVVVVYDVPVPLKHNGQSDRCRALLESIRPGGSFLLTNMQAKSVKAASRRLGIEVTVRKDEKDPAMSRVWRLA